MKKIGITVILSAMFLWLPAIGSAENPVSTKQVTPSKPQRDGSSMEKAIIIKYIGDYGKSIGQEYEYLSKKFGVKGKDWELLRQALIAKNGNSFDEMTIKILATGEKLSLYFDITEPIEFLNQQLGGK